MKPGQCPTAILVDALEDGGALILVGRNPLHGHAVVVEQVEEPADLVEANLAVRPDLQTSETIWDIILASGGLAQRF